MKKLLSLQCILALMFCFCSANINGTMAAEKSAKESKAYHQEAMKGKRPIKLLAIGNSWSVNATKYMGEIMEGLGLDIDLQVSYRGGCPLDFYWKTIQENSKYYQHYVWTKGKGWSITSYKLSIDSIAHCRDFDVITIQQASHDAGRYFTYQPYANNIIGWLRSTSKYNPYIYYQNTWAYPDGSTHYAFGKYDKSSDKMYNAVRAVADSLFAEADLDGIMPSAPVIRQVRQIPGIPTVDTPDGTHLSAVGEYAAGCVWVEMLLRHFYSKKYIGKKNIKDCTYKLDKLSENQAKAIREIAYEVANHLDKYYKLKMK